MKKFLLLLFAVITNNCFYSQLCGPPSQTAILHAQNADILISNGQNMWQNQSFSSAAYVTPTGSNLSVFYAGGLWIGGLDNNQSLHLAGVRYNTVGNDFFAGPLTTDGLAATTNCYGYDHLYYITRAMVTTHLEYYNAVANGTADVEFPFGYDIPNEILEYPAQGNVSLGEAQNLAPFYDFNNDGEYNPYDGDCPLFSGMGISSECTSCDQLMGDEAFFWINNDKGNFHTETLGQPFGIEIHNAAYVFLNPTFGQVAKSSFYQKKIINRSSVDYHDVYVGIYVDADIGNSTDDYVGCDIGRNLGYAYNGDSFDEAVVSSAGYGDNPPAAGVIILKGPPMVDDGIDNDSDGIIDNEYLGMSNFIYYNISGVNTSDPQIAPEYYNYLRSHWKDGVPLTYGGNGHDNNSGIVVPHMFPDDYVIEGLGPWTETALGTPPGDRRFLMSMGPFDLNAGEQVCIHYAAVVGDASQNVTAIEDMKNKADYITNQFDLFCSTPVNIVSQTLFPGKIDYLPKERILNISTNELGEITLVIANSIGQIVVSKQFNKQHSTSLAGLANGLYVVKIQNNDGLVKTKKILLK